MTSKTEQSQNVVGGHQAGRDVNVIQAAAKRGSTMSNLVDKFRREMDEDKELRAFIESLQYYLEPVDPENPKTLEEKLKRGRRGEDLREALALKELFAKKLHQHQLSPTAQEIFAYILGSLHAKFIAKIKPLLAAGKERERIDTAVVEDVRQPALSELEDNILIINYQELRGMIYYHTGTCHLSWSS